MIRPAVLALSMLAFGLLAAANTGGYRYGVSDQAFYIPAAVLAETPDAYPLDRGLIVSQARLLVIDEVAGAIARGTGASLPVIFLVGYLLTLAVLFVGAVTFARACQYSWWAVAAFVLLLTFRHRIAKTGANSLEGYMHPRMLAFGLGVMALAALVRGRIGWAAVAVGAAGLIHPTTALWFAVAAGVGAFVAEPAWRRAIAGAAAVAAAASAWVVLAGPLEGRLGQMDEIWLAVLASKDYLFPTDWPAYAWLLNLAYPVVIVLVHRRRVTVGAAVAGERALVAGMLALTALFVVSIPLTAGRIALAVELQITRVFWVMDVVIAASIAWWLTSNPPRQPGLQARAWRPAVVVAVLAVASLGRGLYVAGVERASEPLVSVDLAASPWHEAMTWLADQPEPWHVLADPDHAWKYGSSVRVSARRDTLVESSKDSAISLYDRRIALQVAERLSAVGRYDDLTDDAISALATRYALDVAVVERPRTLPRPVLFENRQFVVYDLR